jgi:hypothetical protein
VYFGLNLSPSTRKGEWKCHLSYGNFLPLLLCKVVHVTDKKILSNAEGFVEDCEQICFWRGRLRVFSLFSLAHLLLFHLHLYQKPVPQQTLKTHEKEKFCRRASDSNPLEPHLLLDGARLLSLSFSLLLLLHLSITLSETRGAETHKTS